MVLETDPAKARALAREAPNTSACRSSAARWAGRSTACASPAANWPARCCEAGAGPPASAGRENGEIMTGALGLLVRSVAGDKVALGLQHMTEALKAHAEG